MRLSPCACDLRQHRRHHALGVIPHLVGADALFRPGRELDREIALEAEIRIGRQDQIVDLEALVGELIFGAEHMRVVLGKAAHAHQAMHRARRLVAMHHAEFGEAQRQVAIALQAVLEDLHMAGAVHRLEREPALVLGLVAGRLRREHVLAVPVPMAGGLPQRLVEDLRRVDLAVIAGQPPAHIGDQLPGRWSSPWRARTPRRGLLPGSGTGRARGRACGGRASRLPRSASDRRRALPAWRTPCRRCASASDCCSCRANRRPPPSSA